MFIRYYIELSLPVAEATVKDFLDRIGAAITDLATTNAGIQAVGHEGGVEANAP